MRGFCPAVCRFACRSQSDDGNPSYQIGGGTLNLEERDQPARALVDPTAWVCTSEATVAGCSAMPGSTVDFLLRARGTRSRELTERALEVLGIGAVPDDSESSR